MSCPKALLQRLDSVSEITLSVKGRKSGTNIPRLIWFVHDGDTLYLLRVQGSDTNWDNNFLADPTFKISINAAEEIVKGKSITESSTVDDVVKKFKSKYGEADVKKYYPKTNVAVEVPL